MTNRRLSNIQLRKIVRETETGELLFINAIMISEKAIEVLREMIKGGTIEPLREEVEKVYKDIDAVMSGYAIIPQMYYRKIK